MPRLARIDEPFYPYHVIQRGNRNQKVFLSAADKDIYLKILKIQADFFHVEIWAYCLMDNHVHLIVYPKHKGSLTACISQTHQQYTKMINFREGWRGHLWQGRFMSVPMDEKYLFAAVRYVELNPVRAKMVKRAEEYRYSSAYAHIHHIKNNFLTDFFMIEQIKNWKLYLSEPENKHMVECLRVCQRTGRPLGNNDFVLQLGLQVGVDLALKHEFRDSRVSLK